MKNKLRIGVIFGGRSGEHEVSLVSARSVIRSLDQHKYEPFPILVDKKGKWRSGPNIFRKIKINKIEQIPEIILTADPCKRIFDVAFPLIHGTNGEDGTLQGFLELANLPYVGDGVLASAVAMDKIVAKQLLAQDGLPVVKSTNFLRSDWRKTQKKILNRINKELTFHRLLKRPNLVPWVE